MSGLGTVLLFVFPSFWFGIFVHLGRLLHLFLLHVFEFQIGVVSRIRPRVCILTVLRPTPRPPLSHRLFCLCQTLTSNDLSSYLIRSTDALLRNSPPVCFPTYLSQYYFYRRGLPFSTRMEVCPDSSVRQNTDENTRGHLQDTGQPLLDLCILTQPTTSGSKSSSFRSLRPGE